MTLLIVGLSLSFIAIGVLYYLNNELKKRLERNNKALLALHKEFTQYQVSEKRSHEKEIAKMEIRHDHIAKSIKKNEDAIYGVNKTLPEKIRKVIGHIEFARPLDKK
jgi:hypothetical protein